MRILWVDDIKHEKSNGWFDGLEETCEIVMINDYNKAFKEIRINLHQYDLVILDINLEDSGLDREHLKNAQFYFDIDQSEFLLQAGFHLFVLLMEQGFPKSRIAFLTGNVEENRLQTLVEKFREAIHKDNQTRAEELLAKINNELQLEDQKEIESILKEKPIKKLFDFLEEKSNSGIDHTYNEFKEKFKEARIIPPLAIRKNTTPNGIKDTNNDLIEWANESINDKYLLLRRGIIDGCDYFIDKIEKSRNKTETEIIQFNRYFKDKKRSEFNNSEAENYLQSIKNNILNEVLDKRRLELVLKIVLRTIAHEWEDRFSPKHLEYDFDKQQEYRILESLGWVLKVTRNLVSHSKYLDNLSYKDISFLFLVNCRAMFCLGNTLLPHEKTLLRIFEEDKNPNFKESLSLDLERSKNITYKKYLKHAEKKAKHKKTKIKEHEYHGDYNYWVQINAEYGSIKAEINFIHELYRIFFHCLYKQPVLPFIDKSPILIYAESFYNLAFNPETRR